MRNFFESIVRPADRGSTDSLYALFAVAVGVTAVIFLVAIVIAAVGVDAGQFGDFFGGTLNPLLTFLTFMGLLVTIVLQQAELRETRAELIRSADALENQIKATDRQNFESTFFQMLTLHNTIVNSIDLHYSRRMSSEDGEIIRQSRETKGRDCFSQFFDNFKKDYESTVAPSEKERFQGAYDKFWSYRQQDLAHYYRYLYNVLRFVHESKGIEDKLPYVKLLRAQLSDFELVMLFYTALNRHGINYWIYIHEYQMFDNLQESMLIDPSHVALYSERSFGMPKRPPPVDWPPAILAVQHEAEKNAEAGEFLPVDRQNNGNRDGHRLPSNN